MDFSVFAIIAVFMALAGARVVRVIFVNRKAIFDEHFTEPDRALVDQAAFLLLIPISVALHELGHATMVWVFGGKVIDFGFYIFAGYVSYEGFLTNTQQILIAVAGVTVNTILAALAMGLVLLRRPPMRAAYNELLVQFATLSIANALIFYPLIDLATGVVGGDFRQMYDGGVPWLSGIILACHLSILATGFLAFRSERFSAHIARLTGLPPGVRRGFLGGVKVSPGAQPVQANEPPSPHEATMRSAFRRVASGWDVPLRGHVVRQPSGPSILAVWLREDGLRTVGLVSEPSGAVAVIFPSPDKGTSIDVRNATVWKRWAEMPGEDDIVLAVRLALEEADRRPARQVTPEPAVAR